MEASKLEELKMLQNLFGPDDEYKLNYVSEIHKFIRMHISHPEHKVFLNSVLRGTTFFLCSTRTKLKKYQHLRKNLLQLLCNIQSYLLPENPFVDNLFTVLADILEVDNKDNGLLSLQLLKCLFKKFPKTLPRISNFKKLMELYYKQDLNEALVENKSITDVNEESAKLEGTATVYDLSSCNELHTERNNAPNEVPPQQQSVTNLPKSIKSFEVWAKLPQLISTVLENQTYCIEDFTEIISLLVQFINYEPDDNIRQNPAFRLGFYIGLLKVQLNVVKLLFQFMRDEAHPLSKIARSPELLSGFLVIVNNCPVNAECDLPEDISLVTLRHELLELFEIFLKSNQHIKGFIPEMGKILTYRFFSKSDFQSLTSFKCVRPFNFSTLVNFVSDIHQELSEEHVQLSIAFFGGKLYDSTLKIEVHIKICELLQKLVCRYMQGEKCLRSPKIVLEVCNCLQMRLKSFREYELPFLLRESINESETVEGTSNFNIILHESLEKGKFKVFPSFNSTLLDCKNLIKHIIRTLNFMTLSISCTEIEGEELLPFVKFVKYAMQVVIIFNLSDKDIPEYKMYEEERKNILVDLAKIFTKLPGEKFFRIFFNNIENLVSCILKNPDLQTFTQTLLFTDRMTSKELVTLLLDHYLNHMEMIIDGGYMCKAYLDLLSDALQSVNKFSEGHEVELKYFVVPIFKKSMELIKLKSAIELRITFLKILILLIRAISKRKVQSACNSLVPHLPLILESLNNFYNSTKNQEFRKHILELCLIIHDTLPQKHILSNVGLLMNSAADSLMESKDLTFTALKNIDSTANIDLDFLYHHIFPLRNKFLTGLKHDMQISKSKSKYAQRLQDEIIELAFCLLGKFRELQYGFQNQFVSGSNPTFFKLYLDNFEQHFVFFPIDTVIKSAHKALVSNNTSDFHLQQCWLIIKSYLAASIDEAVHSEFVKKVFESPLIRNKSKKSVFHLCSNLSARELHKTALIAVFAAAFHKSLSLEVYPFFKNCLEMYILFAISEEFNSVSKLKKESMDPYVIIDAVIDFMVDGNIENGIEALKILIGTASVVLGSEVAWKLDFLQYYITRMRSLCYEHTSSSKFCSCKMMKIFLQESPPSLIFLKTDLFVHDLLNIIADAETLNTETTNIAKSTLMDICILHFKVQSSTYDLDELQAESLNNIIVTLLSQVVSSNKNVRREAKLCLETLAKFLNEGHAQNKNVFHEYLKVLPNWLHLCRVLPSSTLHSKIGMLEGFAFYMKFLAPTFKCDFTDSIQGEFFCMLKSWCKTVPSFDSSPSNDDVSFYKAALCVLSLLFVYADEKYFIIEILYEALECSVPEVSFSALECMMDISAVCCKLDIFVEGVSQLFSRSIGGLRELNIDAICHFNYLFIAFGDHLEEEFRNKIFLEFYDSFMKAFMLYIPDGKTMLQIIQMRENLKKFQCMIFYISPILAALLLDLIKQTETHIQMGEKGILFEQALPLLQRFPEIGTYFFLYDECNTGQKETSSFIHFLETMLSCSAVHSFREHLMIELFNERSNYLRNALCSSPKHMEYTAVRIVYHISKHSKEFQELISDHGDLVLVLRKIWNDEEFQLCHFNPVTQKFTKLKEYKYLAKCLLTVFKCKKMHHKEMKLLFDLLKAPIEYFPEHFKFLLNFFQFTFAEEYSEEFKKEAFLKFADDIEFYSNDLQAKIFQFVFIPSFANAFGKAEFDAVMPIVFSTFFEKILYTFKPDTAPHDLITSLVQFSCLWLKYCPDMENQTYLKKLLEFAKLTVFEETCFHLPSCSPSKSYGDLLCCYLFQVIEIEPRIVLQVLRNLLGAHYCSHLSRYALNLLIPQIVLKMKQEGHDMIIGTVKNITETGYYFLPLMEHIFSVILQVNHIKKKVFYCMHDKLIEPLICAANHICFKAVSMFETKILVIDVIEVITAHLLQRKMFLEENKDKNGFTEKLLRSNVEIVIEFLLKFVHEFKFRRISIVEKLMSDKCIPLLKYNFDLFPSVKLQLEWWFDDLKKLRNLTAEHYVCTGLEILNYLLTKRQIETFELVLKHCFVEINSPLPAYEPGAIMSIFQTRNCSKQVSDLVCQLLTKLLELSSDKSFNSGTNSEKLHKLLLMYLHRSPRNLKSTLMILNCMTEFYPDSVKFCLNTVISIENIVDNHLSLNQSSEITIGILNILLKVFHSMKQDNTRDQLIRVMQKLADETRSKEILLSVLCMVKKVFSHKEECVLDLQSLFILLKKIFLRISIHFKSDKDLCRCFFKVLTEYKRYDLKQRFFNRFLSLFELQVLEVPNEFFEMNRQAISSNWKIMLQNVCSESYWGHESFRVEYYIELLTVSTKETFMNVMNDCFLLSVISFFEIAKENSGSENGRTENETQDVDALITRQSAFQEDLRCMKSYNFLHALSKLCYLDEHLAENLWIDLFPKLCSLLNENEKKILCRNLDPFLKNTINLHGRVQIPRSFEVFVTSVLRLTPPLQFSLPFYKCIEDVPDLSQQFCLHLEEYLFQFSSFLVDTTRITDEQKGDCVDLLLEAYSKIKEEDLMLGMLKNYAKCPKSYVGFAYECKGFCEKAFEQYFRATKEYSKDEEMLFSKKINNSYERKLCYTGLTRCDAKLDNWSYLMKEGYDNEETLSCDCKERFIEEHLKDKKNRDKFWKLPLYLCPWNLSENETLPFVPYALKETLCFCLQEMKTVPHISSPKFSSLLLDAVKLKEYKNAFELIENHVEHTEEMPFFHTVSAALLTRITVTPSVNDDLLFWDEIYAFRQKLYTLIDPISLQTSPFSPKNAFILRSAGLFSYNESLMKWAVASQNQGYPQVCMNILKKIEASAMDWEVMEQYLKAIVYQVNITPKGDERIEFVKSACKTIEENTPDLKVDMKYPCTLAMVCAYVGKLNSSIDDESATKHFERSFEFDSHCSKNFEFYGEHCEKRFFSDKPETCKMELATKAVEFFMKTCKYKDKMQSQKYLAKVLFLLSYDDAESVLEKTVVNYGSNIPSEYWLPWVPQLVTSILRSEDGHLSSLFKSIGKAYPQAVYFSLKHENYSLCKSRLSHILNYLNGCHPNLFLDLAQIVDQLCCLGRNLNDTFAKVKHIESEIYDHAFKWIKTDNSSFFQHLKDSVSFLHELSLRNPDVFVNCSELEEIQQKFENSSLFKILTSLLTWLSTCINQFHERKRTCEIKSLQDVSIILSKFHSRSTEVEIFDSFLPPQRKNSPIYILQFLPRVEIMLKHNAEVYRIYMLGVDGNEYPYLIMSNPSNKNTPSENRVFQLFLFLNSMLKTERGTSVRSLQFNIPAMVSFMDCNVKILQDNLSSISLLEIYKEYSRKFKTDPVAEFFKHMCYPRKPKCYAVENQNHDTFMRIQHSLVPKTNLKEWVHSLFKKPNDYWAFRQKFSQATALVGFTRDCFKLSLQYPDRMHINKPNGDITTFELKFVLKATVNSSQEVPFRLTPNISEFLNPAGIYGTVAETMLATAECFKKHEGAIEAILKTIVMDEFFSDKKKIKAASIKGSKKKSKEVLKEEMCEYASLIMKDIDGKADFDGLGNVIRSRIESACDPKLLCQMKPDFFPWL